MLAQVRHASVHGMSQSARGAGKFRLQAVITDGRGELNLTFFGAKHLVDYWQAQLRTGARGIFAGKVGAFRGEPQLTHPDFVIVDEDGNVIGGAQRNLDLGKVAGASGRIGLYPATAKLRTWTIASCVSLALDSLEGMEDPLPEWVRREADLMSQPTAYRAVHRPDTEDEVTAGVARVQFDEAFGLQLAMARRRALAAADGAVAAAPRRRRPAGRVRREAAVRADGGAAADQRPAVRRPGPAAPDAAAAAGRGGLGQDRGGAAGDADGGRHRRPGRAAGAHRGARRPAPPDDHRDARRPGRWGSADLRRDGHRCHADHRLDVGRSPARGDPGGRLRGGRDRDRYPRAADLRHASSPTSGWWWSTSSTGSGSSSGPR